MELDLGFIKRFFKGFYNVIILFVVITAIFFGLSFFSHVKAVDHYITELQEEIIRLIELDIAEAPNANNVSDLFFQKFNSLHLELISNVLVVKPNGEAFFTTNVEKKYSYNGIGNNGSLKLDKLIFEDNLMTTKRLDNNYEIIVMTSNSMIKKMVLANWFEESRIQFSLSILVPIIILVVLKLVEDKLIKDLELKFLGYFDAIEVKDQEREELYRGLYYYNRCVMLLIDPDTGEVIDGNEAATAYYGYEFKNRHIKISEINTMPPIELKKIMDDALSKRRNYFVFQHRLANGMIRDVEVYSGPVIMEGKALLCSIIHDVTDKIRAEQNLLNQQVEMEHRIQEKSEILATISHEIKTPIAGIIHNINDLSLKTKDQETQRQLQFLKLNVNSLNRLVFDLLDYSRIDAGGFKFYSTQFNLLEVMESAVDLFRPIAVEKEIRMSLDTSKLHQKRFVGDAFRIGQIINNLISNSVKYTHDGSIDIRVSDELMGRQSLVTITIEDTGIGMKPEVVDQIFKRFYTTDTSGSFGGTGLGLAICRLIVEAMSGTLEVTSEEGIGTAMTLVLELDNDEGADMSLLQTVHKPMQVPQTVAAETKAELKVLIVDDDPMSLLFIEKMLKQLEYLEVKVDHAYNGKEALNAVKNNAYQCIFVDYQLPDFVGNELLKALRTVTDMPMKVVLMSAETLETTDLAVDAFLLKPIEVRDIELLIGKLFGKPRISAEHVTLSNQVYLGTSALENLLEYMGKDELQGILEVFDNAISDKLHRLPETLTPEDVPEVLKLLHALKGSISYFRADSFIEILLGADSALRELENFEEMQVAYNGFYKDFTRFVSEVAVLREFVDHQFEQFL